MLTRWDLCRGTTGGSRTAGCCSSMWPAACLVTSGSRGVWRWLGAGWAWRRRATSWWWHHSTRMRHGKQRCELHRYVCWPLLELEDGSMVVRCLYGSLWFGVLVAIGLWPHPSRAVGTVAGGCLSASLGLATACLSRARTLCHVLFL